MSEKKFDELFHDTDYVEVNQKIYHQMNKKIYSKVIKGFVVICLIITTIFFGTSQLLNVVYYNPNHEEKFLKDDNANEFEVLFSTYYQMLHPGIIYVPEMNRKDTTIKSLGFGRYESRGRIQSIFEPLILGPKVNTSLEISRSKIEINGPVETGCINEFKDPENKGFQAITELNEMKKEIENLPDSAYLDISLSFENYISLEDVSEIIRKYPNTVRWIALKNQSFYNVQGIAGGMSTVSHVYWTFTDDAEIEYPMFMLPYDENITANSLREHYLSHLKLLLDHPDFINALSNPFGYIITPNKLKENYEKAQKELLSYGIRVYIDKKDILKLIEEYDVSYININDVKLSRFQK